MSDLRKAAPQALSNEVNANVFLGGLTGSLTGSLRPCSKSVINERGDLRDYSEAKEMQAMLPERPSSENNRDDIIRMAGEAGWTEYSLKHPVEVERLERFANLVAAAQRQQLTDEQISVLWHQSGEQPFKFARMLLK